MCSTSTERIISLARRNYIRISVTVDTLLPMRPIRQNGLPHPSFITSTILFIEVPPKRKCMPHRYLKNIAAPTITSE
ncbi:MAG: hypothetical protein IPL16_07380 [Ignavibacteria bacterium]|nr:hypothetical protein [Ignavibacteria bacterium]